MPDPDTETNDEFDDALDELIASRDEAPATDAAADDGGDPIEPERDEPEAPGSEEEAGKTDPAAAPAPADTPTDIWANAPAELREAYQREQAQWQHRLSSTQGRLSRADRELARLRNQSGATPGGQGGQQPGQQPARAANPFESEDLKKLEEEYGDVAGPLLNLTKGLYERLNALEAPVAEVTQQRANEARQSEVEVFTSAHPDWQTYVNDDRYLPWLEAQPKAVQDAAARAINVEDGQEAAWLLTQFKASLGASQAPAQSPSQPQQPRHDPKRARQLAAGRDGGGSAPPVQSGIPDDFDGATDAILAQRNRQASRDGRSF